MSERELAMSLSDGAEAVELDWEGGEADQARGMDLPQEDGRRPISVADNACSVMEANFGASAVQGELTHCAPVLFFVMCAAPGLAGGTGGWGVRVVGVGRGNCWRELHQHWGDGYFWHWVGGWHRGGASAELGGGASCF